MQKDIFFVICLYSYKQSMHSSMNQEYLHINSFLFETIQNKFQMEKAHKQLQQTTSTSFYEPASKKSTYQTFPLYQPMKSSFPEITQAIDAMNDRTPILLMEEEVNQMRKKLRKCQQNIGKISQVEELKAVIEKMQQEIAQAREKYLLQHSEIKQEIESMLACLEKQLQNYKKEWQKLRNKCGQQLTEQIEQIKTQKVLNQTYLTAAVKTAGVAMREDINQFTQELKLSRKNRNLRTSKLFAHLQSVRNNLGAKVAQEQAKRAEYDEIIYGLLDKTCENAANALRRRVY